MCVPMSSAGAVRNFSSFSLKPLVEASRLSDSLVTQYDVFQVIHSLFDAANEVVRHTENHAKDNEERSSGKSKSDQHAMQCSSCPYSSVDRAATF